MDTQIEPQNNESVKSCCARLYESDYVKLLLGDSFHPGGVKLTERLGEVLGLTPESRVLDVAAGQGASAIHLAQRFGCQVVGVDYGSDMARRANENAAAQGVSDRVRFEQGDAERLPFPDAAFDAIICECAFCTFPDKAAAAREFARALKPGGRVGLSDLTRAEALPKELDTLLAWIACIADALPVTGYAGFLQDAGLTVEVIEPHDDALTQMVNQIRAKLLGAELLVGLKKLELPDVDFAQAKAMAQSAAAAIRQGKLGYAIITGINA
ncbi:MAG TPA: methyltransferase domain-containing protein [Blastocatellia bacterium]|nr:methyltransferase domain-containing protein [Blastocatellia bacterium]